MPLTELMKVKHDRQNTENPERQRATLLFQVGQSELFLKFRPSLTTEPLQQTDACLHNFIKTAVFKSLKQPFGPCRCAELEIHMHVLVHEW